MRLAEPIRVGPLMSPNRIVYPALVTRLASEDGEATPELAQYLAGIAAGGVGMLVIEATAVGRQKSGPLLRLGEDRYVPGLAWLCDRIRSAGNARLGIQLVHFLKLSRSGYRQTIADLSIEQVRDVISAFAAAADRARQAGVEFVELHAAHAYTLSSFLSRTNQRADRYGGDEGGRARALLEVLAAVRDRVGPGLAVGCRINGDDCIPGGNGIGEARLIAGLLVAADIDYISVSAGGRFEDAPVRDGLPAVYEGPSGQRAIPPASLPDAVNIPLAAEIRQVAGGVPVIGAGKIPTPALAERLVADERVDLVAVARPLLRDPDWPRRALLGQEVAPCRYCNECVRSDSRFEPVYCCLTRQ